MYLLIAFLKYIDQLIYNNGRNTKVLGGWAKLLMTKTNFVFFCQNVVFDKSRSFDVKATDSTIVGSGYLKIAAWKMSRRLTITTLGRIS